MSGVHTSFLSALCTPIHVHVLYCIVLYCNVLLEDVYRLYTCVCCIALIVVIVLSFLTLHFLIIVAKLKAEATRIEMEAELTCQTKVSYSVNNPVLL